jgi:hypothetical protein
LSYRLGNIPADAPPWLVAELRKLQEAANAPVDGVIFNTLYAAPKKLYEGLTVVADGTVWDPLLLVVVGRYKVCYLNGAWRRDA